jgi:hypothetical protein
MEKLLLMTEATSQLPRITLACRKTVLGWAAAGALSTIFFLALGTIPYQLNAWVAVGPFAVLLAALNVPVILTIQALPPSFMSWPEGFPHWLDLTLYCATALAINASAYALIGAFACVIKRKLLSRSFSAR